MERNVRTASIRVWTAARLLSGMLGSTVRGELEADVCAGK